MADLVGERPLNLSVELPLFLVDRREVAGPLLELSDVEIALHMVIDIATSGRRLDDFEGRSARRRDDDRRGPTPAAGRRGRRRRAAHGNRAGWFAGGPLRLPL